MQEELLRTLPFWQDLTDGERDTVRSSAMMQHYPKGEMILSAGCDCLGMLRVISGSVRVYMLSDEGREITLFRLHEGDVCVLSASCVISHLTFETQMSAERDTDLMTVGSGVFRMLTDQNIRVRCFMYELLMDRFSSVIWTMQEILFKGFDRRLAAFLLREYQRTGQREIPMTHEQIAQSVSSAREVVARMLRRFSEDGLVELRRGSVRLIDIEQLRLLGE